MATISAAHTQRTTSGPWSRVISGGAAAATLVPFALCELTGETGTEITAGLVEDRALLVVGTYVAVLVGAALFVAAARVGRRVPGLAGAVLASTGAAVALMYVGYYSAFGAGAILADPASSGPGLGESAWLVLNAMELIRFAPGLALVAAAVAAGPSLPRAARIPAAVLAVMTAVPLTSWVAALLIPVWLGVVGATVGRDD